MQKRVLGKGLSALIPARGKEKTIEENSQAGVTSINISSILSNSYQPRKYFDEAKLRELADSIKEKGLIQPIIVRKKGDNYELIAGERRIMAMKLLNVSQVPAIVRDADDTNMLELSVIENIQREDLNPLEEAKAYETLIEKFGYTQEKIAQVVGKERSSVSNMLRILKLPQLVQASIKNGEISIGHAKALLGITDEKSLEETFRTLIADKLTVRDIEELISQKKGMSKKSKKIKTGGKDEYIQALEDDLQKLLGTKVRITNKKNKGTISISYYSQTDLERLADFIKGKRI